MNQEVHNIQKECSLEFIKLVDDIYSKLHETKDQWMFGSTFILNDIIEILKPFENEYITIDVSVKRQPLSNQNIETVTIHYNKSIDTKTQVNIDPTKSLIVRKGENILLSKFYMNDKWDDIFKLDL